MAGMLPRARKTLKHLRAVLRRGLGLYPVLLWGASLWLAVAAVPAAFLHDDEVLTPAVEVLLWACPAGMAIAALSGEALAVLGAGLTGLLPVLIACPGLQGARTTGAVQGLLVAILALGFVAAAWRHPHPVEAKSPPLRRLLPRQRDPGALLTWLLGAIWLGLAWFPAGVDVSQASASRAVRVAGVAVCWLAVRLLPLAQPSVLPAAPRSALWAILGRRALWLVLLGGLLWAAHRPP